MFDSFHSEGTIPSTSDKFASGVLISSTISLSSFGGINFGHMTNSYDRRTSCSGNLASSSCRLEI